MRAVFCIIVFFIGWFNTVGQELTVNGGAESPPWLGWFQPDMPWNSVESGTNAGVGPHSGQYYFAPGSSGITVGGVTTSEAYQNINLTSFATQIDAGTASFTFSGWRRGYTPQGDKAQIIVEYRDAFETVIDFYDTGSAKFNTWINNTDTRNAPIGTRSVRIRLISTMIVASTNDGYYDDISFKYNSPTCTPPTSVVLTPGIATSYCLGSPLTISATVSPANANYYYTWFKNSIAQTTPSTTYAPIIKAATVAGDAGTYTLRVEDGNAGSATCYKESSVVITIDAPPVAGSIATNQEICSGSSANPLTGTGSTGGTVVKNYKWQSSTSSATGPWATAQAYSTTATGYSPGVLTTTTYYRRIDSSGACLGVPTSSITIAVDAPTIAGTISSDQVVCIMKIPDPLTGTPSSGGTTSRYYKWQRSIGSSFGPWVTVQPLSTTGTDYTPVTMAGIRSYYRRMDSSGTCPTVPTNIITITGGSRVTPEPITSSLRDTLCIGENFQLTPHILAPPFSVPLNGGFYYSWRKVQGASSTELIPPTIFPMASYPAIPKPATLADSGTYYIITQDGPMPSQCKDSVKIVIRINQAPTQKALIQSNQEFCLGSSSSPLTELSPSAGSTGVPLYYQWYKTKDTTGTPVLTKIPVASTSSSYDPGTPATTDYFVRKDSVKYCPAVASNFLKIRVNNKPILDSIRATVNDTLCVNFGDQFQLKGYIDSITPGKASINGGYYFTWKKLQQPATVPIELTTAEKYTDYPANSRDVIEDDSGTYYLYVQDGIGAKQCMDFITFKVVVIKTCIAITCTKPIVVSAKVAAGSNDTLCVGSSLVLQKGTISVPATPPTFGYTYSWIRTNTSGTVIVQPASTTYQDLVINSVSPIDSGRYQLVVRDGAITPAICAESSMPISIVIQNPITQAGIGNDTIICKGNAVLPFLEKTANTGGTGVYKHQWQTSADNNTFTNIPAATNVSYQSPPISIRSYFRRIDESGVCAASTSNTVEVNAYTGVDPGTIELTAATLCYNTVPTQTIQSVTGASGGTGGSGSETYQWQISKDNTTWTNIAGANTPTYKETNLLTDTMYYRRAVGMGPGNCDTAYTTAVAINVYAPLITGSIDNDTTICSGDYVHIKEQTPATGNNITYQWITSIDKGITWATAPGNSTSKEYITLGLADTTWYKRVSRSSCEQDSSNAIHINVVKRPIVFAGNDTIVYKNSVITLHGKVTGSTNYFWTPSTGLSNPNVLNPDATIKYTINYILKAIDPTGLCNAQSSVTIRVKAPLIIPNVITPNGDGINDTWSIEHIEDFPHATFMIYNRWGNIVWKAENNSFEWNGTNYRNGELLPDGTYFYIIDLKSTAYDEPYTGYIQIVR